MSRRHGGGRLPERYGQNKIGKGGWQYDRKRSSGRRDSLCPYLFTEKKIEDKGTSRIEVWREKWMKVYPAGGFRSGERCRWIAVGGELVRTECI